MKMLRRFQVLGTGEETTRSLERAIMAPSLNTANMTIRIVGKYLQTGTARSASDSARFGACMYAYQERLAAKLQFGFPQQTFGISQRQCSENLTAGGVSGRTNHR